MRSLLVGLALWACADPPTVREARPTRSTQTVPLVLGHRGLAWDHPANEVPENTAASVRAALAAGADGVEVDLYKSLDDVFVLAHDNGLDARQRGGARRTNCTGEITRSRWGELERCRVQPGKRGAPTVPLSRLEAIIDLPDLKLLVLDVKSDRADAERVRTIDALAELLHDSGAADRTVLMLYSDEAILRAHDHGLRTCHKRHLLRGLSHDAVFAHLDRLRVWGQCPSSSLVDERMNAGLRRLRVEQVPYLLGHRISDRRLGRIWSRFGKLGVRAIITDRVAAAHALRLRHSTEPVQRQ